MSLNFLVFLFFTSSRIFCLNAVFVQYSRSVSSVVEVRTRIGADSTSVSARSVLVSHDAYPTVPTHSKLSDSIVDNERPVVLGASPRTPPSIEDVSTLRTRSGTGTCRRGPLDGLFGRQKSRESTPQVDESVQVSLVSSARWPSSSASRSSMRFSWASAMENSTTGIGFW